MRRTDAIVIGAGPAGCAAATVLAEAGHDVLLVDRPPGARRALAESIPPSANRLLVELGMDHAVAAAGFQPCTGNTVWWAGAPPRVETFAPEARGYQVERARFDAVLRDVAIAAGAQLITGTVKDVAVGRGFSRANLAPLKGRPTCLTDGEQLTAPWVLDCSGRAGVIARKGLRVSEPSHRTVALAGIWRAESMWPPEHEGHTLVASHVDGWAWSVPAASGLRYVTVMVDPERSHLTRGTSALDVYRAELGKVAPFSDWLAHARLEDGPWGADASLYGARQHAGPGFLLAGDAATFIDPLSSFGVKKALASGWLAGVVVHTLLTTPAMQDAALSFFETRERAIAASFRQQAARYAVDAGVGHPFWQARVADLDAGDTDVNPAALAQDPDVLAAMRDLQGRPAIHLRAGGEARVEKRPVIRSRSLVLEDHLCLPAWPGGLRYIRNIDLVLVMRLAEAHRDVGDLYEAVVRVQPGVSLPDFLGVLATLLACGGLQHGKM